MIIGITGGTGCGKTTLLSCIEACGGVILDCDAIYHRLLETQPSLLQAIEYRFPGSVRDGTLDRKALGSLVFSDPQALLDLNTITHTAVRLEVQRILASKPKLAAIDAIGLFEGGLAPLCDLTVAITAPREDRILRLMRRDGISRAYAEHRIDAQHDESWFSGHCGFVLENSGNLVDFQEKCMDFLSKQGILISNGGNTNER